MEAVVTIGCMHGSRGGVQGIQIPSLKDLQNIGFLSNTGPESLKNYKGAKPAFNVSPSLARRPMVGRFQWYVDHLCSHQL